MEFVKMNESGITTIGIKELNDLIFEWRILDKLEKSGIDKWESYQDALEYLEYLAELEIDFQEANKESNS
jgi:hypothetical protein